VLGIHDVTGTLEQGKRADVVVWNHNPLSVYAKADVVLQGGEIVYRRSTGKDATDFELGNGAMHTAERTGASGAKGVTR
jgi:urease alpha subunit